MDSRKSGLVVKQDVFIKDEKSYGKPAPPCLAKPNKSSAGYVKRGSHLFPFILDELLAFGQTLQENYMKKYSELWKLGNDEVQDPDLLVPYNQAVALAEKMPLVEEDLKILRRHVKVYEGAWLKCVNDPKEKNTQYNTIDTNKKIKRNKNARLAKLTQQFQGNPEGLQILGLFQNLDNIKVSYAYYLRATFAYSVGMRQLCDIKAKAKGSTAFTTTFAETMSMSSATVRVLQKSADDMEY